MSFADRFRSMLKGDVPAESVDALLRATGQLEDLRQRIETARLDGETRFPGRPWEVHAELGPALAYFWIAQAEIAIGRALRETAETGGSAPGFMPQVSSEQAVALLRQATTALERCYAALETGDRRTDRLPVPLRPRVESRGRCPVPHLKGMVQAARYLDGLAEVEVESYGNAVTAGDAPEAIREAAQRLRNELAQAQFRLRTAEQAVSPILGGQTVSETTHEDAEGRLWSSLATYGWLGQVVAIPELLNTTSMPSETAAGMIGASGSYDEYHHGHHGHHGDHHYDHHDEHHYDHHDEHHHGHHDEHHYGHHGDHHGHHWDDDHDEHHHGHHGHHGHH